MTMLGPIVTPLRTLLFAVVGAALAWLWYNVGPWLPVVVVLSAWAAVVVVQDFADRKITTKPQLALNLFELRLLGITVVSAAAAAAVIVATVSLATPDGTDPAVKEVVGAATAALTAFIAGISVSAEDADENIGDFVKARFQARFVDDTTVPEQNQKALPTGSEALYAVFSSHERGWTDWSKSTRHARIDELDKYLNPKSA